MLYQQVVIIVPRANLYNPIKYTIRYYMNCKGSILSVLFESGVQKKSSLVQEATSNAQSMHCVNWLVNVCNYNKINF